METKLNKLAPMESKLGKLDTLESMNRSLNGEISKVQNRMKDLTDQMSFFTSELSKQDKKWEACHSALSNRISEAETVNKRFEEKWEVGNNAVLRDLKSMQSSVDSASEKIVQLENNAATQKERLDAINTLEKQVKQAEEQIRSQKEVIRSISKMEEKIKGAAEEKFQKLKSVLKKEVRAEIIHEFRVNQKAANAEVKYDILKDKAFAKRHNVVVYGLAEADSEEEDLQAVSDFFTNRMELPDLDIDVVILLDVY